MKCRHCDTQLQHVLIDLVNSPVSNALLTTEQLNEPEIFYPLKTYVCHNCFLVQIDEYKKSNQIFNDEYVYFSSYSSSWLKHSEAYVEKMMRKFSYTKNSLVAEIASNDGYLLQYFHSKGIPVLGIEPTKNTAKAAKEKGVNTITEFFGEAFAKKQFASKKADLLIGNNVLAHVPDINDFVKGMKNALANTGVITMEFPHVLNLINQNQFDTIYHEHFSYLSLYTVKNIFESFGLNLFDVEEIPTHGGSLRIYAKHKEDDSKLISNNVNKLLEKEAASGLKEIETYLTFTRKVQQVKYDLLNFIINAKKEGKTIAGYGAAAKGNTLLNYCGLKSDSIDFCVDASPHKQNKFMPGSHIPIVNKEELKKQKPDYVIIFPWNIKEEIIKEHDYVYEWGGKFVIPIPKLEVI